MPSHEYYVAHREKYILHQQEHYKKNTDKLRENAREYRKRHGDEIRAKERARYHSRKAEMQAKSRKDYAENRTERIAASRKWQREHPEQVADAYRRHNLWRWYRMTVKEFDELFASQDRKCAICRCSEVPAKHHWHVDHNHSTGQIRGILCSSCNLVLGHSKDDPNTLRAAADYLICKP